mmetsp:Transcript_16744/g.46014  ORF Transcript_16744/g.46014 Transcript_16744/m.46014 type:complete len:179 (+) Transcript_16744:123-659(+)
MARQLSAQFLGNNHTIDLIPHKDVMAIGAEYYNGSGIQSESPAVFRQMTGMVPIQVISLGRRVSRSDFEMWFSSTNGFEPVFSTSLERNCNHFAHSAAVGGLQMSSGVPDCILHVPQRFMASPLGQMGSAKVVAVSSSGWGSVAFQQQYFNQPVTFLHSSCCPSPNRKSQGSNKRFCR